MFWISSNCIKNLKSDHWCIRVRQNLAEDTTPQISNTQCTDVVKLNKCSFKHILMRMQAAPPVTIGRAELSWLFIQLVLRPFQCLLSLSYLDVVVSYVAAWQRFLCRIWVPILLSNASKENFPFLSDQCKSGPLFTESQIWEWHPWWLMISIL